MSSVKRINVQHPYSDVIVVIKSGTQNPALPRPLLCKAGEEIKDFRMPGELRSEIPVRGTRKFTVVTVNSTGRQAASFVRVASAVGWHVRAQVLKRDGLVADELAALPNVTLISGHLEDPKLVARLFQGADIAFVNTTHWGDEVSIGCALADAAKAAGIKHYVYSSMPDHSSFDRGWKALPLWVTKAKVERHIRKIGLTFTFVYAGIYNNNFTTLPYPLFRMELQPDKSLVWQAPFHPHDALPWLDAEHDVGPALLQIFKEGPERWAGHRIPLTFEVLSPLQVCEAFSKALSRPVIYRRGPIEIQVPIPAGYHEHLFTLQEVLGDQRAPYFGPDMYYPHEAIQLWEGNRGMEEYAGEAFLVEERANGLTWMDDDEDEDGDTGTGSGTPAVGTPMGSEVATPGSQRPDLNFTGDL